MPVRVSVTGCSTKEDDNSNDKSTESVVNTAPPEPEEKSAEAATMESSKAELASSVPAPDTTTSAIGPVSIAGDVQTASEISAEDPSSAAKPTVPATKSSDSDIVIETVSIGDVEHEDEKKDGTAEEAKQEQEQLGKVGSIELIKTWNCYAPWADLLSGLIVPQA
jgi:hypothetical protein